jgi:NAD(P)-dependent dehydrogenase (short-subunit alcohol dehydrogenase family)
MHRYVVLGSTGAIGSELAKILVERGDQVLLVGRNQEKLAGLAQQLGQPYEVWPDFSATLLEEFCRKFQAQNQSPLSGFVNCIGSVLLKPVHLTTDEEFTQVWQTNVMSSFAMLKVATKLMRQQGGSILLFGTAAAEIGIQNHEAIAAAKGAVISMARSAAATYAPTIRVNVLNPGLTRSEMTRKIWEQEAALKSSVEMHALGRIGEPHEVAACAAWMLAPECSWMTGQVINIDGGLSRVLAKRKSTLN